MRSTHVALLLVLAGPLGACTIGDVSGINVVVAENVGQPPPGRLPPVGPDEVPTPAIAKTCQPTASGDPPPLAAIRPGVGTLVRLHVMNVGYRASENQYKNATTPVIRTVDLPLRLLADRDELDDVEKSILFEFLTTNRQWDGKDRPGPKQALSSALEQHPARLWNAFVRTLCMEVRIAGDSGRRKFVPLADIAALCRAAPLNLQTDFARALVNEKISSCPSHQVMRGLQGLDLDAAEAGWASAALETGLPVGTSPYFWSELAGPASSQASLVVGAVGPFGRTVPDWSLAAWQASKICLGPAGQHSRIVSLRLKDGRRDIALVDDATGQPSLAIVGNPLDMHVVRLLHRLHRPSLGYSALRRLTAADVDDLSWAIEGRDGEWHAVDPPGCTRRG